MSTVVYGDFTCPFSYLASLRVDLLADRGDEIEWRAVEHAPHTPLTGLWPSEEQAQAVKQEWQQVEQLLLPGECLPGRPPAKFASTQAAVAGYAEAVGASVGPAVRRLLFHAYWVDGLDIGNPEVLRLLLADTVKAGRATSAPLHEFGYAVTPARGPVTAAAYRLIRQWRSNWDDLGDATLPALQRGGETITGVGAVIRLGDLTDGVNTVVAASVPPAGWGMDRLLPTSSEAFWY